MNPEHVLVSLLEASPDLVGLVKHRMYPDICPPTVLFPMLTYRLAQGTPEPTLKSDAGTDSLQWEVEIWDTSHAGVKAVGDATRAALEGRGNARGAEEYAVTLTSHAADYEEGWGLYHVAQSYSMQVWVAA